MVLKGLKFHNAGAYRANLRIVIHSDNTAAIAMSHVHYVSILCKTSSL